MKKNEKDINNKKTLLVDYIVKNNDANEIRKKEIEVEKSLLNFINYYNTLAQTDKAKLLNQYFFSIKYGNLLLDMNNLINIKNTILKDQSKWNNINKKLFSKYFNQNVSKDVFLKEVDRKIQVLLERLKNDFFYKIRTNIESFEDEYLIGVF